MSAAPIVRTRRVPGAPVVAVRALAPGGARLESAPAEALVCGRLLDEGSERRDWRRIAAEAEARGAVVSSWAGYESIGVSIDALAADWELALEWAAELLFEPAFPEERRALVARQAVAELEAQADQADLLTHRGFLAQLYSPHPRGRPLAGDAESPGRVAAAQCRRFHAESLERGVVVTVAGELDVPAAERLARRLFSNAGAPAGDASFAPSAPPPPPPPAAGRGEVSTRARDQAHLFVGQLSVPRGHPDFEALELAGVVLGSGALLTGRIPERIREREGLAYAAAADTVAGAGLDAGRMYVYVGAAPAALARAERAVVEELRRFRDQGPTGDEVESARAYLLGREPFRRETARQWADLAATAELYALPLEDPEWTAARIRALDRDQVAAAVARHLDPDRLTVTVGLPSG